MIGYRPDPFTEFPVFAASWQNGEWREVLYAKQWTSVESWILAGMIDFLSETDKTFPSWEAAVLTSNFDLSMAEARAAEAGWAWVGGRTSAYYSPEKQVVWQPPFTGKSDDSSPWDATYASVWSNSSKLVIKSEKGGKK